VASFSNTLILHLILVPLSHLALTSRSTEPGESLSRLNDSASFNWRHLFRGTGLQRWHRPPLSYHAILLWPQTCIFYLAQSDHCSWPALLFLEWGFWVSELKLPWKGVLFLPYPRYEQCTEDNCYPIPHCETSGKSLSLSVPVYSSVKWEYSQYLAHEATLRIKGGASST
jgi:hypothetical protein